MLQREPYFVIDRIPDYNEFLKFQQIRIYAQFILLYIIKFL